jgi:Spy/CpxP family protein refolding chaperone
MKEQTTTHLIIGSALTLVVALAFWPPIQTRSAEPAAGMMMEGGMMSETNMMQRCQEMKAQKDKMTADMNAQDAELVAQTAEMNSAPPNKKLDAMAAIVTRIVEQRAVMNVRKAKMDEEMMQHMMQHMQMGMESMSKCPMMMDMKDMKSMDTEAAPAPTARK